MVAKGIQKSLFIGHGVSPSYVNMATIHCRARFSPQLYSRESRSSRDLRVLSHFHYVSLDPKFQLWIFKVTEGEMGKLENKIDF